MWLCINGVESRAPTLYFPPSDHTACKTWVWRVGCHLTLHDWNVTIFVAYLLSHVDGCRTKQWMLMLRRTSIESPLVDLAVSPTADGTTASAAMAPPMANSSPSLTNQIPDLVEKGHQTSQLTSTNERRRGDCWNKEQKRRKTAVLFVGIQTFWRKMTIIMKSVIWSILLIIFLLNPALEQEPVLPFYSCTMYSSSTYCFM